VELPFGTILVSPEAKTIGSPGCALMKQLASIVFLMVLGACAQGATLLVVGDSLSAAYGMGPREGWVTLLEERLRQKRFDYNVVNASISGETTSGGAARIAELLARTRPEVVVVALGGNDGLRGLPTGQMKDNLSRIVGRAKARGARVLLVGVRVPPNYGTRYAQEFEAAFREIAERNRVPLVPYILEGVGERRDLMQEDNIHPSAAAQPKILENIWPRLEPLLGKPYQRTTTRGSPAVSEPITAACLKSCARKISRTAGALAGSQATSRPPLVCGSVSILRCHSGLRAGSSTDAP
jgi:acyl-CoA thioesterase-1